MQRSNSRGGFTQLQNRYRNIYSTFCRNYKHYSNSDVIAGKSRCLSFGTNEELEKM